MDVIRIYPWATDTAGCFYQRLKMPLDALERNYPGEFEVCWSCEPKPGEGGVRSVVLGQRIMGNGAEPDPRWMDYCRNPGIMAVIEFDDDVLDLDPGNTVPYSIFMPNREGTVKNIAAADHVIVSTPALGSKLIRTVQGDKHGGNLYVDVAPNCVADGFVVERNPDRGGRPLTIGWAGSMFHQQDFTPELVGQLAAVRDMHPDVRWVSIGANYLGWGSTFGWGPIDRYHARLDFIDIGIAPIARTPFNASKSWIKALDYMARGVVPVVEDWGQYPDLIGERGDRFDPYVGITTRYADWTETLNKAIMDITGGFFDHDAVAARAREYEISRQIHRWADVFRKAVDA